MEEKKIIQLKQGLATAFINYSHASNLAYKPQFISNNYKEGRKVISSVEDELLNCEEFAISVAFITMGGITPLLQTLRELEYRGVRGKILTTDYLTFSEPEALRKLAQFENLELKMFVTENRKEGFHTKGYIFKKEEIYRIIVGSSNMTSSALTTNREWNTKIVSTEQGEYTHNVVEEFDQLWNSEQVLPFEEFIERYTDTYTRNKVIQKQKKLARETEIPSLEVYRLQPNSMQVGFINNLQNFNLDPTQLVKSAEHIANLIEQRTGYDVLDTSNIMSAVSILPKIGQVLMGGISGFAINVAVLVLILYFMLIGGAKMEKYVYSILPFSDENKKNVLNEINMIVTSNAIGIPLLAIIQGLIALLGYWIFDVPSPFLFGFLTCFATIIPVVGTALVWLPLALYMTLTGDWVNAAGLTAYALIIITNVDNLIRFILQKKMADTHPLITIFGVIIGLSLFGFMGIIFGPLLISIFILCFNIFKEKYLDNDR